MMRRIEQFLFYHESDVWIGVLRIGLAIQLIGYCFALRGDWVHLLSSDDRGLVSRELMEATLNAESASIPRLSWLIELPKAMGISEPAALWMIWSALLVLGVFLLLGLFSRTAAIAAWFIHLCVVKSAGYFTYGVDNMTTIASFYLMLCPLPDRFSLDFTIRQRRATPALMSFFRRILQIHLCLIYFFGGLAKLAGIGWWDGTNLWRALTIPPFQFVDPQLVLKWKAILPVAGAAICLLEFTYPFFIWSGRTRAVWLAGICVMHLMIALTMGMYSFGFIMIVLNLAAFLRLSSSPALAPGKTACEQSAGTN